MSAIQPTASRRLAALLLAAVVTATALSACGGGGDGATDRARTGGTARTAPNPAAPLPSATSPARFAASFEHLTGVRLQRARDTFGTRFEPPRTPDRWPRFGTYGIVWTGDDRYRDVLLGPGPPDANERWWERDARGDYSVARTFGPRLVVEGPQGRVRAPDAKWLRLERAVQAAFSGDVGALPEAEQPCRDRGLNALHGVTGACSVEGMPVTFVDALDPLRTPLLEARVRGVDTAAAVGDRSGTFDRERADGRFVVIAYTVRNTGAQPIASLNPRLHLAGRTFEEDPAASALMPRSTTFPIAPGATYETRAVFDVPTASAARASSGALVLPAAPDERGAPDIDVEQGWIRLLAAPLSLPAPPTAAPPGGGSSPPPGRPYLPPAVRFVPGSGPAIGATARARYAASTFVPLPRSFVPGGIPVGSRAGGCRVPAVTSRVRAELNAAIRQQTPGGTLQPLDDATLLLADCGARGRWALVTWVQIVRGNQTEWIDDLRRDGSGWTGTARNVHPGCRVPRDAAAVWQVDVTACGTSPPRTTRPAPPPRARPLTPPRPRSPRAPGPRRVRPLPEGSARA